MSLLPVDEGAVTYSPAWDMFLNLAKGRTGTPVTRSMVRGIPGVARALQVIAGMAKQMPLDDYRGSIPQPRPRLLDRPDPDRSRPWFVGQHIEDYLLHGNAVHYVTSLDAQGRPATCVWLPAHRTSISIEPGEVLPTYWYGGEKLRREYVIHVQRGASDSNTWRGIGVIEQHLAAMGKIGDQEAYETEVMRSSAVPSVVVEVPNSEISQDEASAAQAMWADKYGSSGQRVPAVVPKGTKVTPLAWSPHDAQLAEVRKLSLVDTASMFNLDGYWLSAPASSMTYRSPGSLYVNLLRQTVEPIITELEEEWSFRWLPNGRRVQFDRTPVLRDDLAASITTMGTAVEKKLYTIEEARTYLGRPPEYPGGDTPPTAPIPPALAAVADTQQEEDQNQ